MIIPVRCFTCNQLIAHKWLEYNAIVKNVEKDKDKTTTKSGELQAFEKLAIKRDCCRRHFLAHIELVDII